MKRKPSLPPSPESQSFDNLISVAQKNLDAYQTKKTKSSWEDQFKGKEILSQFSPPLLTLTAFSFIDPQETTATFPKDIGNTLNHYLEKPLDRGLQESYNSPNTQNSGIPAPAENQYLTQARTQYENLDRSNVFHLLAEKNKLSVYNLGGLFGYLGKITDKQLARTQNLDLSSLIDQIVHQVSLIKGKGKTEVKLSLRPDGLGDIWIKVSAKEGVVSLLIIAPPWTKEILDQHLAELEKSLKDAHVNVGNLEVSVGEHTTEQFLKPKENPGANFTWAEEQEGTQETIVIPSLSTYSFGRALGLIPEPKIYFET